MRAPERHDVCDLDASACLLLERVDGVTGRVRCVLARLETSRSERGLQRHADHHVGVLPRKVDDLANAVVVDALDDRHAQNDLNAHLAAVLDAGHLIGEHRGLAAYGLVGLLVNAVEGEVDTRDARVDELLQVRPMTMPFVLISMPVKP